MIGKKIRFYRKQNGMSIKDLAEKVTVSNSYVSQVEMGKITPSVDNLRSFAKSLKIPVFVLLSETEDNKQLIRGNERQIIEFPKIDLKYEIISSDPNNQIGVMIGKLGVGQESSKEAQAHNGEECITILNGRMEIELGDTKYILEKDDSIYLSSLIPHRFVNISDKSCVFLLVVTPPRF